MSTGSWGPFLRLFYKQSLRFPLDAIVAGRPDCACPGFNRHHVLFVGNAKMNAARIPSDLVSCRKNRKRCGQRQGRQPAIAPVNLRNATEPAARLAPCRSQNKNSRPLRPFFDLMRSDSAFRLGLSNPSSDGQIACANRRWLGFELHHVCV